MSEFVCRVCKGRRLIDGPSGHPEDATNCPACEDDEAHQRAEARTDYECHDGGKCIASDKKECDSKCRKLAAHKAAPTDADRIEWLNGAIFMPKWNGVLGGGSEVNWTIAGDWRHTCARMTGNDFRAAIDAAMASGKSAS